MLSRRGQALVAAAAAMIVAGVLVGVQELVALGGAALLLTAASTAWVHSCTVDVRVDRHVHPSRIAAGGDARVALAIRNTSLRRTPVLTVCDPFDGGRRRASFSVAPLQPGQAEQGTYRLPTTQRGIFALGPLEVSVADPFGLARRRSTIAGISRLIVYPRVESLAAPDTHTRGDRRTGEGTAVLGAQGQEFYALREYRVGDDLRRVHWRATARTDEVMIRQMETTSRGRLAIGLDLRRRSWTPPALEAALCAAATLATAAGRAGLDVRLVDSTGGDTGYLSPRRQGRILDALAAATTHPNDDDSLAGRLRWRDLSRAGDGMFVAIVSDAAAERDLAGMAAAAGSSRPVVVMIERSTPSAIGGLTGVVRVRVGGSFAAAWSARMGGAWPTFVGDGPRPHGTGVGGMTVVGGDPG